MEEEIQDLRSSLNNTVGKISKPSNVPYPGVSPARGCKVKSH